VSAAAVPARRSGVGIAAGALALAALSGPLVLLPAGALLGLVGAGALVAAVAARPALGAFILVASTPLLGGIERGRVIPMLRPSEALLTLVVCGLGARGLRELLRDTRWDWRPNAVEWSLAAFVMTGSVVPLLMMAARGRQIGADDIYFATYLWKYATVYAVVRCAVRRERDVAICLGVSVAAAAVVGCIAILQSLNALGVPGLLSSYWTPSDGQESLNSGRGTATLSSSFAVADLMVFNLAIVAALLARDGRRRALLVAAGGILVLGTIGAGQFSGYIGLLVGAVTIGVVLRRLKRLVVIGIPSMALAGALLWPVIARRLVDLDPVNGLPISWVGPNGRWSNLTTFFWPELFHHWNWVTGVRVAARVPAPETWRQWVWIESGHTWLLWSGGVPFLIACFAFLFVGIRTVAPIARRRRGAGGAAAVGALAALWVNFFLLTFDVHMTLRGSADLAFTLLALSQVRVRDG
jgi:hypothetical protein